MLNEFIQLKNAVKTVEDRYIATKLVKKERENFLMYRETVIYIQRRFRLKLEARNIYKNFQQTRKSILGLQVAHARGFLSRRYFNKHLQTPENIENRRINIEQHVEFKRHGVAIKKGVRRVTTASVASFKD